MNHHVSHKPKCLFIGVDGATDEVIGPMTDRGDLPTLARLRAGGAYGRLKSQEGYGSPALWASIESGYAPADHGILGFKNALRGNLQRLRVPERLARAGWTVGLCRMFCYWPPEVNEVFVVPSFADTSGQALPPWVAPLCEAKSLRGLRQKAAYLARLAGASLGPSVLLKSLRAGLVARRANAMNSEAYFQIQRAQHWLYVRLFRRLTGLHHPDYAALLMGIADAIGHRYWQHHNARQQGRTDTLTRRFGTVVERAYMEVDRAIGEILRLADKNTLVVIASDHGMELVSRREDWVPASSIPEALCLPPATDGFYAGYEAYFALPSPEATEDLLDRLSATRVVRTGQALFNPCNIRAGRVRLAIARDTPADPATVIEAWNGSRLTLGDIAKFEPRRSGDHGHGPDGILLLSGPGVKAGARIEGAAQLDVAPTLLALLNQPIPREMTGRILSSVVDNHVIERAAFTDTEEGAAGRESRGGATLNSDDEAVLEERLRDLGYID